MVSTRVKDLLPLRVRPFPYLRRTPRANGDIGQVSDKSTSNASTTTPPDPTSLSSSHLRPTSSHPNPSTRSAKLVVLVAQLFARNDGSRSPHTCRLFESTWSRPFEANASLQNMQSGYLTHLALLVVLFLLVEHGIGFPSKRPVMGKRSHWENIGVDKETFSSVSLFSYSLSWRGNAAYL